jgi:formate hydrogenlyase subunit 3/multisubunit Na+/H+ antiporter MnhD subunit
MIAAIIFGLHGVLLVYAFVSRWKRGGAIEALLAGAFVIIVFSVGWTLASLITRLTVPAEGFAPWLNADTVSLLLVTAGETLFYALLLRGTSQTETEGPHRSRNPDNGGGADDARGAKSE